MKQLSQNGKLKEALNEVKGRGQGDTYLMLNIQLMI